MEVRVEQERALQPDVADMVGELTAYLDTISPPEANFHLNVEQLNDPAVTVFVARTPEGRAVGMGALRREPGGIGEIKRMYTRPEARRKHVGSALLDTIIALARAEGLKRLVLETGDQHPEAWRLYESRRFTRTGPVLDYPDLPTSVFYEKPLDAAVSA
jgi:putative acetyltransferase